MPKKKPQLSNKKIIYLTVCILLLGAVMLVASLLLSPESAKARAAAKAAAEAAAERSEKVEQTEAPVPTETPSATDKPVAAAEPETQKKATEPEKTAPAAPAAPETVPAQKEQAEKEPATQPAAEPAPVTPPKELKKGSGKIAIVFDDAGHNISQLKPVLDLPFPVTVAVIPKLAHSRDAADMARAAKNVEVLLHQPMQAVNLSINPGEGAITPELTPSEIRAVVRENLEEVGPVAGLNNHEGSFITADELKIGPVLDVCLEQGIFFLDSRTNAATVAPDAAKSRGMDIYERDIFLDNSSAKSDILEMVEKGLSIADKKGYVIMIGHVWTDELADILKEIYPELVERGYTFTTVSGTK